jgi:hypothetical protein
VNFAEWRSHVITVLRQQIEAWADLRIQALLAEVMAYPVQAIFAEQAGDGGPQRFATPLKIATPEGTVSFLSTTTIFGTPTDVTLSELALEMLFPADSETIATVARLNAEEQAPSGQAGALAQAS